ncbi:uncharacterized protein [Parasteatoda tepidariorum]|uniref:uncharacterized protein n=1 Tax=Parasteatoda tepidariorum TaxID=114398 RepID=UPI00077FB243|nr:uncharacterized protein LOC107451988 [Parasteatoda tepidariorum]
MATLSHHPIYAFTIISFLCVIITVEGQIELCHDVYAPFLQHEVQDNCTLVCTLKLQHAVSNVHDDELALCVKNSSIAIFCTNHGDCRHYHVGAYCKMIPCFCRSRDGKSEFFVLDAFKIPRLHTCVVSARYVNPELPIIPFPWKTLLIVFTIIITFLLCLVAIKCLSKRIRKWQAKRIRGDARQRMTTEDNATLFTQSNPNAHIQNEYSTPFTTYFPRGMPRIYRANPRSSQHRVRQMQRAHYTACAQAETSLCDTLSNQDKPPPYEAAVQALPPSYEDVERALHEEERVEIHTQPIRSSTLPPMP